MKGLLFLILVAHLALTLVTAYFEDVDGTPGTRVWEISGTENDFEPEEKFFALDKCDLNRHRTYVILHTDSCSKQTNVHFWFGLGTRVEMRSATAGLAITLWLRLNDRSAGLYRETEGAEQDLFKSYFPNSYAMHHGEPPITLQMYKVKSSYIVPVRPVIENVNMDDSFVVNSGSRVFIFHGLNAQEKEKKLAERLGQRIHNVDNKEGGDMAVIKNVEPDDNLMKEFIDLLGGGSLSFDAIPAKDVLNDAQFEAERNEKLKLIEVSNQTGELKQTEIEDRPLVKSMLKSGESYIMNSDSPAGLFVWIGNDANPDEIKGVAEITEFVAHRTPYDTWSKVSIIMDRKDQKSLQLVPTDFLVNFFDFLKELDIFDEVDKTSGIQVWRIGDEAEDFAPRPIRISDDCREFHQSGEAYIILQSNADSQRSIHSWFGRQTSEKVHIKTVGIVSALWMRLINKPTGVKIFREMEDNEQDMFKSYFSQCYKVPEGRTPVFQELYKIKGSSIMLVPPKIEQVNKDDGFLLDSGTDLFVFSGPTASPGEKKLAMGVINRIDYVDKKEQGKIHIIENTNPEDKLMGTFIKLLGGDSQSFQSILEKDEQTDADFTAECNKSLILFEITLTNGKFESKEVKDRPLRTDMLNEKSSYVLVAKNTASKFLWIGSCVQRETIQDVAEEAEKVARGTPFATWSKMSIVLDVKNQHTKLYEPTDFLVNFSDFLNYYQ